MTDLLNIKSKQGCFCQLKIQLTRNAIQIYRKEKDMKFKPKVDKYYYGIAIPVALFLLGLTVLAFAEHRWWRTRILRRLWRWEQCSRSP